MIGLTSSRNYEDIASAIRSKGGTGTYKPDEMAEAIRGLGSGVILWNYPVEFAALYRESTENNTTSKGNILNCNVVHCASQLNKTIELNFKPVIVEGGNIVTFAGTGSLYIYLEIYNTNKLHVKFQYAGTALAWVNVEVGDDVKMRILPNKRLQILVNNEIMQDEAAPSNASNVWDSEVGQTTLKYSGKMFDYLTIRMI